MSRIGLRIDKWLWHIRLVKTRSLAARLCADGQVMIGDRTVRKSSEQACVGDRVTLTHAGWRRVLEVKALGERRGPAVEAHGLYEEAGEPVRLSQGDPGWTPLIVDDEVRDNDGE